MSAAATRGTEGRPGARADRRPLEAAEAAWLAMLPLAALVVLAIVLLAPPLGRAVFAPGGERFFPEVQVAPEPTEHARFVLALLGAPLAAAAVLASRRLRVPLPERLVRAGVLAAQAATVAFLALTLLAQHGVLLRAAVAPEPLERIFSVRTILVAAALTAAAIVLLRPGRLRARVAPLVRETPAARIACALVAVALVAIWLAPGFNTERTVALAEANHLIAWDLGETFAVLDGRTPLVDFHGQYAQLLPYPVAAALTLLGTSLSAWTATLLALSAAALLAVYATLRRVLRGSLLALAAFVVFLAGSATLISGRLRPTQELSIWPMRYAGPYLLLWLTARHLDGSLPRRRLPLVLAAALVAINNVEFGLPAMAGTVAAVVFADPPRAPRAALRLALETVGATLAAAALVALFSALRAGSLPDFGVLLEFPRIYGIGGWVLEPMAPVGLHLALYATFVAAAVVATVRVVRREDGALLTGLLVWSGIFGLGASSYYAGRSDRLDLIALFSAWALALLLLAIVVARRLLAGMRPSAPDAAVLFGCALLACAVAQAPLPWRQLARLEHDGAEVYKQAAAVRFVRATAGPGEKVGMITLIGPRVAYDAGVVDVVPYAGSPEIPTVEQMDVSIAALRAAHATRVYVDQTYAYGGQAQALEAAGYRPAARAGPYLMLKRASP